IWRHRIPKPQAVLDNRELRPHVEELLCGILELIGASKNAAKRFTHYAYESAKKSKSVLDFEKILKRQLVLHGGIDSRRMQEVIKHRAKIVYQEIEPYLAGRSLLDVGCGNGLISNLAKRRFRKIQLLDVVEYLDSKVCLPFALFEEGAHFPVSGEFD